MTTRRLPLSHSGRSLRLALHALTALVLLAQTSPAQGPPPPPPPPQPLPPVAPAPAGNPVTAAKTNLGKALFHEEQLGSNRTVACATCHLTEAGGSDPRSAIPGSGSVHPGPDAVFGNPDDIFGSIGVSRSLADGSYDLAATFRMQRQVTGRRAPSMVNAGFAPRQFWDGRAEGPFRDPITQAVLLNQGASLEIQSIAPPTSDVEMGHVGRDWTDAAARIEQSTPLRLASNVPVALQNWINGRDYPELFQEAFGTPDVTPARIAMAIATYERTLVSNQAPFDQFIAGNPNALTPLEQQGLGVFNGPGRCVACHPGALMTDNQFHYTGVRPTAEDPGRFAVTGNAANLGQMKTPSLRNLTLRAPFFHNGRMNSIAAVVDFYNRGGDFNAPNKSPLITPLGLSPQQRTALIAFLSRPLTDPRLAARTAPFDRPTLYSESTSVPAHYGAGTPGTGGFVPSLVAFEPAVIGNPRWSFGIDSGNAGRAPVLILAPVQFVAPVPFQGAGLHVQMGRNTVVVRRPPMAGNGPGDGWGSASVTIPSQPALLGQQVFVQWLVVDPQGNGKRLASSDAVAVTYF